MDVNFICKEVGEINYKIIQEAGPSRWNGAFLIYPLLRDGWVKGDNGLPGERFMSSWRKNGM